MRIKEKLSKNPTNIKAHFELADLYLSLRKNNGALREFNYCLSLKPNAPVAYYGIAMVYFRLEKIEEAIAYLKASFSRDSKLKVKFADDFPEIKESKLFDQLLNSSK